MTTMPIGPMSTKSASAQRFVWWRMSPTECSTHQVSSSSAFEPGDQPALGLTSDGRTRT